VYRETTDLAQQDLRAVHAQRRPIRMQRVQICAARVLIRTGWIPTQELPMRRGSLQWGLAATLFLTESARAARVRSHHSPALD